MEWFTDPQIWAAFFTLVALEIVLGIDNIVFISILANRLPPEQRAKARQIGLMLAMVMRVLLLLSISWVMSLKTNLFTIAGHGFSGRDLILLVGGLFLIWKSVGEIHHKIEGPSDAQGNATVAAASFAAVVGQILVLDLVFSLDSVITAVGMVEQIGVMVAAVVVAIGVMLAFAGAIADFVEKHPTVKMLALAFLVLIGVNLLAEAFGQHIPRGYTYFAMAFSFGVEMLNLRMRKPRMTA